MEANQLAGAGDMNVRKTAMKVVGNEDSYGVKVQGKNGKETNDIEDLVDMWAQQLYKSKEI